MLLDIVAKSLYSEKEVKFVLNITILIYFVLDFYYSLKRNQILSSHNSISCLVAMEKNLPTFINIVCKLEL